MNITKPIVKSIIALSAIIMLTTPAYAGDNGSGSGRGGRDDCDRGNGNKVEETISAALQQDGQKLLVRRGNDCDRDHIHEHDNDKAGNGNKNGQDVKSIS